MIYIGSVIRLLCWWADRLLHPLTSALQRGVRSIQGAPHAIWHRLASHRFKRWFKAVRKGGHSLWGI